MRVRVERLLGLLILVAPTTFAIADDRDAWFREKVAPIFEKKCVRCHGEVTSKGQLDLSSRSALLKGGDSGPPLVPGKPEESDLIEMITGDPPEMPQKAAPLSKDEITAIREWIARGAAWPDGLALKDRQYEGERWWAFEPLKRPTPPFPSTALFELRV